MGAPTAAARGRDPPGRKSAALASLQAAVGASGDDDRVAGNGRERSALGASGSAGSLGRSASWDAVQPGSPALPAGVCASTYHYDAHGSVSFPDALEHFRERARRTHDAEVQLAFVSFLLDGAHKMAFAPADLGIVGGRPGAEPTDAQRSAMAREMEAEALRWLKKLAGGGRAGALPEAQFMLADMYSKGMLGLPVDHARAFGLCLLASKGGHAGATCRVALSYELGAGTKHDHGRAVQFFRKAAALGDPLAMHKIALILLYGKLGQKQALKEGIVWLKRAANSADARNPEPLHDLAQCYEKRGGCPVLIPDEDYALELYARAAQLGFAPSQFRLGAAYEYGLLGVAPDAVESIKWYTRAAETGLPEAELALSSWYLSGAAGVLEQSDTDAFLWARKAAERRCTKAEYTLGTYFEIGIGVPADADEARRWYARAAAAGHKRAAQRLAELKKADRRAAKRCVLS